MIRLEDFKGACCVELPSPSQHSSRRHNTSPFIKGPIPLEWIRQAIRLPKPALCVGLTLWLLRGFYNGSSKLRIDRSFRKRLGLSADQARRGAHALERAGLINVIKQGRGRCLVVQLAEAPSDAPTPSKNNRQNEAN